MNKEGVVHIYMYDGILFSMRKKEILKFVTTWMDLGYVMLNKINQTKTNNLTYM